MYGLGAKFFDKKNSLLSGHGVDIIIRSSVHPFIRSSVHPFIRSSVHNCRNASGVAKSDSLFIDCKKNTASLSLRTKALFHVSAPAPITRAGAFFASE